MAINPTPGTENDPRRTVYLLDASTGVERRLLRGWIEAHRSGESISLSRGDQALQSVVTSGEDPVLQPLRVVWLPEPRPDGSRVARFYDLLTMGDPRDPDRLRQAWLAARRPDRWTVAVAEPATLSDVRERWSASNLRDGTESSPLASYLRRTATLALERAERSLRGARYKVPRFVQQEVLGRPAFRAALEALAGELGRPVEEAWREALHDLKEIAANHSPFVIDLTHRLIGVAWSQGYSAVDYDRERLAGIYAHAARVPLVFLPSHKSNLDHGVMQWVLYQDGRPPNHTAGGINMNFFPVGPIFRRTGVFFIRRTFKDDRIYKLVLRHYIDFLVERRFPLEWYLEGGRSRTGKLLPPRLGLLSYVVDAWERGRCEDALLVPVSIAYDQIADVGDYVHEGMGRTKPKESLGWFLGLLRGLKKSYGRIHVRFGEPVSVARWFRDHQEDGGSNAPGPDEKSLGLQKLAFEVMVRINEVTPVTASSLVTMALLGAGDRAMTLPEIEAELRELLAFAHARNLPASGPLGLDSAEGVRRALEALEANGVVTSFTSGPDPVWAIGPERSIAAAYYRNTIIHSFVHSAIAEVALLAAVEGVADRLSGFRSEALRLRDLFKFEFFFEEKEAFLSLVERELARSDPDWKSRMDLTLLGRIRPLTAPRVLRPFLDAYGVMADLLVRRETDRGEEAELIAAALALGAQYRLQRRIASPESVSKPLFATAVKLAVNKGLLQGEDLRSKRVAFAATLRETIRRVDAIHAVDAGYRARLDLGALAARL